MVGWHHRLYGHEFEQAPGAGDGKGSLACCSPQRVRHDWVTKLNWGNKFKPEIPEMTSGITPQNKAAKRAAAFALNRNLQDDCCNHALSLSIRCHQNRCPASSLDPNIALSQRKVCEHKNSGGTISIMSLENVIWTFHHCSVTRCTSSGMPWVLVNQFQLPNFSSEIYFILFF